jgi:hypothetical protein
VRSRGTERERQRQSEGFSVIYKMVIVLRLFPCALHLVAVIVLLLGLWYSSSCLRLVLSTENLKLPMFHCDVNVRMFVQKS